jgi:hypothetical protein
MRISCTFMRQWFVILVLASVARIGFAADRPVDNGVFRPTRVHGEVFGLEAAQAFACGKLLVLGPERVEDFGELRRNSAKVAEFFGLSSWTMQTVEKEKPKPAFSFRPSPELGLHMPRQSDLIVTALEKVDRNAGLGKRERAPDRIRKEIGSVKTGPFSGRATMTVTREDGMSVVADIKNMTREEVLHLLKCMDAGLIMARVRDEKTGVLIYEVERQGLLDESQLPIASSYSVRLIAPAENIMDSAGIWGGKPGRSYTHNQETNAVLLMEFLAEFLQGKI